MVAECNFQNLSCGIMCFSEIRKTVVFRCEISDFEESWKNMIEKKLSITVSSMAEQQLALQTKLIIQFGVRQIRRHNIKTATVLMGL